MLISSFQGKIIYYLLAKDNLPCPIENRKSTGGGRGNLTHGDFVAFWVWKSACVMKTPNSSSISTHFSEEKISLWKRAIFQKRRFQSMKPLAICHLLKFYPSINPFKFTAWSGDWMRGGERTEPLNISSCSFQEWWSDEKMTSTSTVHLPFRWLFDRLVQKINRRFFTS